MVTVAILEMMHSEAIGDCEYFESCGGGVGGGLSGASFSPYGVSGKFGILKTKHFRNMVHRTKSVCFDPNSRYMK